MTSPSRQLTHSNPPNRNILAPAAAPPWLPLLRLLKRCTTVSHLNQLHAHLITAIPHPTPPLLLHALFRTYLSLGHLALAALLFDRSPPPTVPVFWNVLIRAYSRAPDPRPALLLLRRMLALRAPSPVHPDAYTLTFAAAACARLGPKNPRPGEAIHALAIKHACGGQHQQLFVGNSLIAMYSEFSRAACARKVFDETPVRDVVTWSTLVDAYARGGEMGLAMELFEGMPERNEVSWAVVISSHVAAGMHEDAIGLFHRMLRGQKQPQEQPDRDAGVGEPKVNEAILVCVLSACAHMGALDQGKWVHAYINKIKFPQSSNIATALIDMYAKCGRISCATQVFESAPRRDVWTWTSMICGLAMHGLGREALSTFRAMVAAGIRPDLVTILGVLNGCSHSGLVDEAEAVFSDMVTQWGVEPEIEHYGCLIDLLGRAGRLEKAFQIALNMPVEPDLAVWRSLLSSCRVHGDITLAERVMKHMEDSNPTKYGDGKVLLSNLYAATNQWEGVRRTRSGVSRENSNLLPGCSWVEVDGTVQKFVAADWMHPRIMEVRQELNEVLRRLKIEGGYTANTKNVLFDLSEEEKQHAVAWHSEKLALAFAILNTEPGNSICIMKTLRICEDCHAFMKAASAVYRREIIVRDRSRFHTFVNGECSCADYW